MELTRTTLPASIFIFLVAPSLALANVTTESSPGASYLFLLVAVFGGIIALLGIFLAFRGVKSPSDVTIKIPGGGEVKFSKVGQGAVVAIIGAIILISALYLYPTTTTKTVTETTTIEGTDGTRTIYERAER